MVEPSEYAPRARLLGLVNLATVREHRGRFIALGAVLVVLGALAIVVPFAAGLVTTVLLGWLLIAAGVAEGVHAIVEHQWGGSGWAILAALIYVIAGAVVVAFPLVGKMVLTMVLTAFLAADGILKIVRAVQHRTLPAWGWLLFDGFVALFLALLLWRHWPSSAAWAIGLLVGVNLLFNGFSMLVLGLGARPAAQARA